MKNWHTAVEAVAAKGKKYHPRPCWAQRDSPFCSGTCYYYRATRCALWKHGDVDGVCKPVVRAMTELLDKLGKML